MTTIFMSAPFDFGTNSNSKLTHDGDDQDHSAADHSSLSFLGFDVRDLDEDDTILRGIHVALDENTFGFLDGSQDPSSAMEVAAAAAVSTPTTAPGSTTTTTIGSSNKPQGIRKRRRRKRTRRPCTVLGCPNRVVQGGVCVAHGARRKLCKFPGCDKCVKKAGFCSTHGPARKRCEVPGCSRVAVQGGICIGHGAKKVPCLIEGCRRQALNDGLCRIHSDDSQVTSVAPSVSSTTAQLPTAAFPAAMDHLCHEIPSLLPPPPAMIMPANMAATSSLHPFSSNFLAHPQGYEIPNAAVAVAVAEAPAPSRAFQRTMYTRGLSIFEEMGLPNVAGGTPMPPPPPLVPPNTSSVARSIPSMQEIFNDDFELDTKKFESI